MRFKEQIVVVTVAGSGIGRAASELIASEGGQVVVNDIDPARVDAVVERIRSQGGQAFPLAADVSDEAAVRAGVDAIIDRHGRVDVLVNNAGIMMRASGHALSSDQWRRAMAVNLDSVFFWCHAVATRSMLPRRQGVIVNVASLAGMVALPNAAAYVASKHAVVGLTKALALDWGPYNVRINALCPGMTWTDLSTADREKNPEMFVERERRIPLGHAAEPIEQAEAIAFLASAQSSAVHGLIMNADGGNLAMHSGTSLTPPPALG